MSMHCAQHPGKRSAVRAGSLLSRLLPRDRAWLPVLKSMQGFCKASHQHPLALQVLATATEEGNILLWQLPLQQAVPPNGSEAQQLQPVTKLQGHAAKAFNVAWSPLLQVNLVASKHTRPAQLDSTSPPHPQGTFTGLVCCCKSDIARQTCLSLRAWPD